MNTHALARALLSGPDVPVAFYQYNGGDDELREVESARPTSEYEGGPQTVVLETYRDPAHTDVLKDPLHNGGVLPETEAVAAANDPKTYDSLVLLENLERFVQLNGLEGAAGHLAWQAIAELKRFDELLFKPEVEEFARGVQLEAAHQQVRWASSHDAGKKPQDWFWLLGYLAGKALHSATTGDLHQAKHHTISSAAALANWHAALCGEKDGMRPGIDAVARGIESAKGDGQ